MDDFYRDFKNGEDVLRSKLREISSDDVGSDARSNITDEAFVELEKLSDKIKYASAFLPAHDQRLYTSTLKTLRVEVHAKRNAGAPKRKFALKRSAQPQGDQPSKSTDSVALAVDQVPSESTTSEQNAPSADTSRGINTQISDVKSKVYVRDESKSNLPSSVSISNISKSVLDLSNSTKLTHHGLASMMIKDVNGSLLLCGNVSGATHITGMTNSTLLISCQQLRMHDCDNCVIYLICKSRPIIEDCSNLMFAPLTSTEAIGDREICNHWDQVDDFNWLKAEPSPNWRIMPADDKRAIQKETVGELLMGGMSSQPLDVILHLAKLDA